MKKFNQLSKAEMKKVSGGNVPIPPCTLDNKLCNIFWTDQNYVGNCTNMGGGSCSCYNAWTGYTTQVGDCYA